MSAADRRCEGSGWEGGEEQEERGSFFKTVVLGGPSQEVMFEVRPERRDDRPSTELGRAGPVLRL